MEPRSPTLQADSLPAEPQGKPKNTGVGSPFLLQRIFLTQDLNQGLLHCRRILYQLSHRGSPWEHKRIAQKRENNILWPWITEDFDPVWGLWFPFQDKGKTSIPVRVCSLQTICVPWSWTPQLLWHETHASHWVGSHSQNTGAYFGEICS